MPKTTEKTAHSTPTSAPSESLTKSELAKAKAEEKAKALEEVDKIAKKHLNSKRDKKSQNEKHLEAKVKELHNRLAIVTELGRMVRDIVKDPFERDRCYWKIIEAADYSEEWHDMANDLSLNALLIDLRFGRFKDIEVVVNGEQESSGTEPEEILLQLQDVQGN